MSGRPEVFRTPRRTVGLASALLFVVMLIPGTGFAQATPAPNTPALVADRITAAALARHLAALTHDSLSGRTAPSPGLERAARYVAAQFAALGLRSGLQVPRRNDWESQDLSWLQRYPIPGQRRLDFRQARLTFTTSLHRGATKILSEQGQEVPREARVSFTTTARFLSPLVPRFDPEDAHPVVLVAGPQTAAAIATADLHDAIVFYVPPSGPGVDTLAMQAVYHAIAAQSHGLVLLQATDSLRFAAAVQAAQAVGMPIADDYLWEAAFGSWIVEVWPGALQGLLAANGVDLAAVRAARAPLVRSLPFVQVEYQALPIDEPVDSLVTLPTVVATLEGSDSTLKREYITFVAHLDQTGGPRGDSTRLTRGADDNASEVAALLALAEAFSQPGVQPKRSLVFLVTTGGAPEFWGTQFFLSRHFFGCVLAVTLDRLSQPAGNSVVIEGAEELKLTPALAWIAESHPELGLTVVDTGTVFRPTGDHYVFSQTAGLRRGIPSLYVHAGNGADPRPQARDDGGGSDLAQEARIVRLVYHLAYELGNAPARPRWNQVGRASARAGEP